MEHTYHWALPAETTGGLIPVRMKKQKRFASSLFDQLILNSGAQVADSH